MRDKKSIIKAETRNQAETNQIENKQSTQTSMDSITAPYVDAHT